MEIIWELYDGAGGTFLEKIAVGDAALRPELDTLVRTLSMGGGSTADLRDSVLGAWRTNCRVTAYLVEQLPAALWDMSVPGAPHRTVRMIVAHFHNSRSRWIKTLGEEHGISAPRLVDVRKVTRSALLGALKRSSAGIEALLELGLASGGDVPPSKRYVWRNLPLDVGHVLTYFVAHEAHHRGQLVMLGRQLGHRLPQDAINGLWQWTTRSRESNGRSPRRLG